MKTNFISRYEKALTRQECRDIIEEIEFFDSNSLLFDQNAEEPHLQDQKAINPTVDLCIDLTTAARVTKKIFPKIKPCIDKYLKTYSILGVRKFMIYDCKIKKIPDGAGFHSWHYENGTVVNCIRQFVIQLYLNDNFDAGETEFLYQHRREIPKKGDVLIFPAGYTHTHRGNPPIGGEKYLITSWGVIQDG